MKERDREFRSQIGGANYQGLSLSPVKLAKGEPITSLQEYISNDGRYCTFALINARRQCKPIREDFYQNKLAFTIGRINIAE